MKLLEFIVILGIFLKGHYVSAIKLSSNYHNRKLLVEGGAAAEIAFVYFSEKCTVTQISADKVAADTATCGVAQIDYCAVPEAGKCATPIVAKDGTDINGVAVYASPGNSTPETTTEYTTCKAVGFAKDGTTLEAKTGADVAVGLDGVNLIFNVTTENAKICPGDNGGAIVCADKLAGIISGVSECAISAKAVTVATLLSGGGGDGSEAPEGEGGEQSTPAPAGGSYAITSSMAITTLPIIIITYLDH